ncbi:TPA: sigma-54 dependent T6SS transcriptional regulator VasH [Vibrio cholerae]|uniref:AAA family ATPase n=1 Tax=Vibrio tarriae TaxID=2014742 RepID=A0AAU8WMX8_9VIBR|nr:MULTISPECIES: sigma-54 dependent T6SS transcriptional regulator VasH [Vibrio]ASK53615.1 AAA family ATPase [Vibrio tarriae]EGQ7787621.1 AAA domain-containing protein [Vibrio cholerae]EGR1088838.1 sigma-54-dependent Fis family transcriptional regulator [Vibrio cholerae]EHS7463155.1 sigma-54 dependent T6SS transcriptional regulator VasH [Vibrio cholerae]EIA3113011.1 sigma-54 dependent T6SS transcriptional regulator VasH [Vibrio cholerae]
MSQWLAFATQLVGVRKSHQLALQFVDLLTQGLDLSDSLLLLPSSDGRLLVPHDPQRQFAWSVTDFDVPFAHVLQSSNAMHLTAEELVFWQSNRIFSQLTSRVGMFDSVWIQPLPMDTRQVHSILLLMGESHGIVSAFENADFLKFIEVFSQQWSLLNDMEREEQRRLELKQSLTDIERDSAQRSLANALSRTLIGESAAMQKLREQIVSAANSQLSVMVQGETGTGKELVAAAVHELSSRKSAPFVAINCAAIPEHLLESELFGYCKGAFSGADSDKQGLIAQANGGTLFLDEIGDMPLTLQAKLLRVLESRTFRPLGGKQELSSDFRLVSATHVNLLDQVRKKEFRQDLYYRLFQYPITLPRLAARLEDIELLSEHFVRVFNLQHNTRIRGLNYRAIDCLKQYDFPGNVRELKHLIEFGCAQTADGTQVEASCFAHRLQTLPCLAPEATPVAVSVETENVDLEPSVALAGEPNFAVIHDLKQAVSQFEALIISERLNRFAGDRAKAAKSLGIPKRTLAYKCLKLEIKTP